jgi:hypothetical protein
MSGMPTPTVHAMLEGMLVIVIPAFVVVSGIAIMAYRRRRGAGE